MNNIELQRDKTLLENKVNTGSVLDLRVTKTFEYSFLKIVKDGKSFFPYISLAAMA